MKRLAWLVCGAMLAGVLIGCSSEGETTEPATGETETSSTSPEAGTGSEGSAQLVEYRNADGKLVCPLMNAVIEDEAKVVSWVEHEGTKYAMCCPACAKKGKEDPALVAEKASAL